MHDTIYLSTKKKRKTPARMWPVSLIPWKVMLSIFQEALWTVDDRWMVDGG